MKEKSGKLIPNRLSTGEAMDLLNQTVGQRIISRSTISRWFDRGKLWGWKNPLSGERMIDMESLEPIMKTLSKVKNDL